jgi:hypothetical protein
VAGVADQSSGKQLKLLDADESHSSRSAHVVDKDGAQNRLTKTMAGNGRMGLVSATMTGLSAEELPPETCPSGTCFLEVPRLCIGGSDVWADGTGAIEFVRKDVCNKDWDSAER